MTEYWKSTARYFCKYCNVTINDDKPSREQHDNGLRHKGNVDRYITGLYKKGAQQKKDKEEEAREIKRIEQLAHAAVGTSLPKADASAAPAAKKPRVAAPTNSFANYTTAEQLGFTDDEPFYLPGQHRPDQGEAGQWQSVAPKPRARPTSKEVEEDIKPVATEEEVQPSHRSFREKQAVFDDDLYDVGEIKLKKRVKPGEVKEEVKEEAKPKFRSIRFGQTDPPVASTSDLPATEEQDESKPLINAIEGSPKSETTEDTALDATKEESTEPTPSLFKKRKRPKA